MKAHGITTNSTAIATPHSARRQRAHTNVARFRELAATIKTNLQNFLSLSYGGSTAVATHNPVGAGQPGTLENLFFSFFHRENFWVPSNGLESFYVRSDFRYFKWLCGHYKVVKRTRVIFFYSGKKNWIEMSATVAPADQLTANANIASPMNVFYFLLVPALLLWFIYWRLSRRHMLELAEKIPGPPGLPLFGNALELVGTSHCEYCVCVCDKQKLVSYKR